MEMAGLYDNPGREKVGTCEAAGSARGLLRLKMASAYFRTSET